ncbi:hypothetical protein CPB83DRAFT_735063, partial [Crepidotus variabilis]
MGLTIISISRIAAAGHAAIFRSRFCHIYDPKDRHIGEVPVTTNRLYCVDCEEMIASVSTTGITVDDLHRCMGHIAHDAARKLVKDGLVTGVTLVEGDGERKTCESCEYAKVTRKVIRKERRKPKAPAFGDEIHSDVWGPARTPTIRNKEYYGSFTDD